MIKKYKIMTYKLLKTLKDIEKVQSSRLDSLKKYDGILLKEKKRVSGKSYYTSYKSGGSDKKKRYKYVGSSNSEDVLKIKEVHHLKKLLTVLLKDIELLESVMNEFEDIDPEHINELLPAVYRVNVFTQDMTPVRIAAEWKKKGEAYKACFPTFYPEELNVPADDGTLVRSKSEALIYNRLLSLGITFIYELPLETNVKTFYPDFTILSEVDYSSVYRIEHQGMMEDTEYSERFNNKVKEYLRAGYTPGLNLFFTFDSYNGGLDLDPLMDIIRLKIRPTSQDVPFR